MQSYLPLLRENALFHGLDDAAIEKLFHCLDARKKNIARDTFVFHAGDKVDHVYLLISGSLHIIDEDFWGNRSIVETMSAPVFFGEAYALSGVKEHLVGVFAGEDSAVFVLNANKTFDNCPRGCDCHRTLLENVTHILSEKVVRLTEKVGHVARRTTREKLLSYLSVCARRAQSNVFDIPYSRQQLADYLCVERSALSHELSKMRDLGLVQYRKNHFELTL